jgi:hypothetical protein
MACGSSTLFALMALMVLFLVSASYKKRKGSRAGVAQAAIASVQTAAASIRTEAAIADVGGTYIPGASRNIPGTTASEPEELIVPGAREAFYGEAIRFGETIVAADLHLRLLLSEPDDDDALVGLATVTHAEEVVAAAANAILPTLVVMTPSPEPAKHSGDTDRSNATTVIDALGGITSRFDRERSQSLPPMTPSPPPWPRAPGRVTFAEQLDSVDAPTASSVVATLAPRISALTDAFAADRVRRESNASPSVSPVVPPSFAKPRSTASQRRIREAQGTVENETEWGVAALNLVIETPEYAQYLEYLKAHATEVDRQNRIENEARNNMHDVLIDLLRRAPLDEFEPLTSRFVTWPERVIEPADEGMMDSFVEGGLTAEEELLAYEYSNTPSPYESRRR